MRRVGESKGLPEVVVLVFDVPPEGVQVTRVDFPIRPKALFDGVDDRFKLWLYKFSVRLRDFDDSLNVVFLDLAERLIRRNCILQQGVDRAVDSIKLSLKSLSPLGQPLGATSQSKPEIAGAKKACRAD